MSQTAATHHERRLDKRFRPKNMTKVTCRKGTLDLGANIILGILDLAETGVRLLVREQLAANQEVAVTLECPSDKRPLRVIGFVAWCVPTKDDKFCLGVRFSKRLRYAEVARLV
jgi:PilZ domain